MRVLVACEYSGTVRDAFTALGHDATSCDLLPTERPGQHIQGDVLGVLNGGWDLVIMHPPCTHLSRAGAKHFAAKRADGRMQQGIDFFMECTRCQVGRWCIENPVGIMSTLYRKPDQYVHPWQYGHEASKQTCLWLNGLPPLVPTKIVSKGVFKEYGDGKRMSEWCYLPPSADRGKLRSLTFQGIADAMAAQWGKL